MVSKVSFEGVYFLLASLSSLMKSGYWTASDLFSSYESWQQKTIMKTFFFSSVILNKKCFLQTLQARGRGKHLQIGAVCIPALPHPTGCGELGHLFLALILSSVELVRSHLQGCCQD